VRGGILFAQFENQFTGRIGGRVAARRLLARPFTGANRSSASRTNDVSAMRSIPAVHLMSIKHQCRAARYRPPILRSPAQTDYRALSSDCGKIWIPTAASNHNGTDSKSTFLDELRWRGFLDAVTSDDLDTWLAEARTRCTSASIRRPTACTWASLIPVMALAHAQRHGHRPLVL